MKNKIKMSLLLDELIEINDKIIDYNISYDSCESYELHLISKQQELIGEINILHDIVFGDNVISIRS